MEIVSALLALPVTRRNPPCPGGAESVESITPGGEKFPAGSVASSRRLSPRIKMCVL